MALRYCFEQLFKLLSPKKEELPKSDTCEGCANLFLYNDGSVSCKSPYEKSCLKSDRAFKEIEKNPI